MSYECPNGHPFPKAIPIRCDMCSAMVTVEPVAHGMALHREAEHLRGLLRELRQFVPRERPEWGPLPGWIIDIRDRVADALREGEPCRGDRDCPATEHIHGCFADGGGER